MSITEKIVLKQSAEKGNKQAIQSLIDEIQRLESIVKDVEHSMNYLDEQINKNKYRK